MRSSPKTVSDPVLSLDLLASWLEGAGFEGFKFDTDFSMYFSRSGGAFRGYTLPSLLELRLSGDWWLGAKKEWHEKVKSLGQGVEPDEPVKAFELAKLRWSEGAVIERVTHEESDELISIKFKNGTILSVSLLASDDLSLLLKETGVPEESAIWSVCFDNRDMYYRMPVAK